MLNKVQNRFFVFPVCRSHNVLSCHNKACILHYSMLLALHSTGFILLSQQADSVIRLCWQCHRLSSGHMQCTPGVRFSDLLLSPKKGTEQPPTFRPVSTVAKRLPISATDEHLYKMAAIHLLGFQKFEVLTVDTKWPPF